MKKIEDSTFKEGFLNPTGTINLIKQIDNGYFYLYLNAIDKRYIKLHERFIFLEHNNKNIIKISLNLYWDTVHVFDNENDWDDNFISQMNTYDLYHNHMKISWRLNKRDTEKLNNFELENK